MVARQTRLGSQRGGCETSVHSDIHISILGCSKTGDSRRLEVDKKIIVDAEGKRSKNSGNVKYLQYYTIFTDNYILIKLLKCYFGLLKE